MAVGAIVDVKEHGAAGNGETDDATALLAAIAEAQEIGRSIVYFPPGEYLTSKALTITAPNITIRGSGATVTTILSTAGSGSVISIEAADCTVEAVSVQGNPSVDYAINAKPASIRCAITGCAVSKVATAGINLNDNDNLVESCQARECGDGSSTAQAGINMNAGERAAIRLNRCVTNGTAGIRNASKGTSGPEIVDNYCADNGKLAKEGAAGGGAGRGIVVSPPSEAGKAVGTRVLGNTSVENQSQGIYVSANTADAVVEGNVCKENGKAGEAGGHGIEVDCRGSIVGNLCSGNDRGISINGEHLVVSGNLCFDNHGKDEHGIAIKARYCIVSGNICYGNDGSGIRFFTEGAEHDRNQIVGNICHSNAAFGILIPVENSSLGLNTCYDNPSGDYSIGSRTTTATHIRAKADDGQGRVSEPTYGATVHLDGWLAEAYVITASNGSAFTVENPSAPYFGRVITVDIVNSSSGVLGAVTWGSEFKLAGAFTSPAKGKRRTISFRYHQSSKWIEIGRAAADI